MEKFFRNIIVCLSVCIFLITSSSSGDIKNIKIVYADNKSPETTLRVSQVGDVFFVSARELAKEMHWNYVSVEKKRKAVLYPEGREVIISGENPYIMIGDDIFQMPVEVKYIGEELFIPLNYFIDCINNTLMSDYVFDSRSSIITVNTSNYSLGGITIEEKKNGTIINIGTSMKFDNISNLVPSDDWIYYQFHGGKIDTNAQMNFPRLDKKGTIREIKLIQTEDYAQIGISLRDKIDSHIIKQLDKSIQISLTKKVDIDKTGVNIKDILLEQKKNWEIDTIVLDPGHGGRDPGCRGVSGTYEKGIVLDIAKRLGNLIEQNLKINVKYTRDTDEFIPLMERGKFANREKGKLFISIHANSTPYKTTSARGVEIYILSPAKDERSIKLAEQENKVIELYEDKSEIPSFQSGDKMFFSMLQSGFVKESERLAVTLLDGVSKKAHVSQRGVKQAGLFVLVNASMPSVLVEVGYMNNRTEEKNLKSRTHRQKIAEGLYEGIKEFVKTNRKDIANTGS